MICPSCGATISDMFQHCPKCGASLSGGTPAPSQNSSPWPDIPPVQSDPYPPFPAQQPSYDSSYGQPSAPQYGKPFTNVSAQPNIPPEYKPLGAWAYFGWSILFNIPFVGFILLIVFACGASKNKNLRAYARSYFCWLLILAIIVTIVVVLVLVFGVSIGGSSRYLDPRYW